jgi:D-tyrosyl-tRNA(Tyr) deacylase
MRVVIQRVKEASVAVNGVTCAAIGAGLLAYLGIGKSDSEAEADYLLDKTLGLRIFPDSEGKMNRNVAEAGGALLIVSQFTLYADCRRGRRPSFDPAAPPEQARRLYERFVEQARKGPVPVSAGVFQAMMEVRSINDGPVTIWMDSALRNLP